MLRYGWSLNRDEWMTLPEDLVNAEVWQSVQLDMSSINVVPESAGVYIMCSLIPGRRRSRTVSPNDLFGLLYAAIYVGMAGNLRNRFRGHCQNPDELIEKSQRCFVNGFEFWFTRLDPTRIEAVERIFIDCLGPPANKVRGIYRATMMDPTPANSGFDK